MPRIAGKSAWYSLMKRHCSHEWRLEHAFVPEVMHRSINQACRTRCSSCSKRKRAYKLQVSPTGHWAFRISGCCDRQYSVHEGLGAPAFMKAAREAVKRGTETS